jgi:hypothetical protein
MLSGTIRGKGRFMATYRELFSSNETLIDARPRIGPHHLAIGKTRKLFEHEGTVHAFFSRGYEIAHARLDGETLAAIDTHILPLPIAWGGGAFCVDNAGAHVALVFLHRNQHELCYVQGKIEKGVIAWEGWRSLCVSRARQAAPWLECGPDGTAWASVLDRDGDFRVVVIAPDGTVKVGDLFEPGESRWYHSCVQMEPVGKDTALAISFRGEFPYRTELVFKTVGRDLSLGLAKTLAPCNVNDKFTFHFQAVGDVPRECAHIVYLDEGLSVSHAIYENSAWRVAKSVIGEASFAPQITIDANGNAALLAAGYDGAIRHAAWSRAKGWSKARKCDGARAPNASPAFQQTGYGTGGMIAAARSATGRVPYLFSITQEDAQASLYAAQTGSPLAFARDALTISHSGKTLDATLRVDSLRDADVKRAGCCWLLIVPAEAGRALKVALAASPKGLEASAYWQERDGSLTKERSAVEATCEYHDAFGHGDAGAFRVSLQFESVPPALDTDAAWAEIYADGWSHEGANAATLCDIAPFDPETAAKMALDPGAISATFRRMV